MLSWFRQKFSALRARYQHSKELKKQADAAIATNPYVTKRVQRNNNRRFFRKWTLRAAFAVAVTGATTAAPDLVSAPLDAHARANGVEGSMQQHFATQNIRVYHRRNPLMPFHFAGQAARMAWQDNQTALGRGISVPINYVGGLFSGFGSVIFAQPLDAYSFSDRQPHAKRQCYIRPPGRLDSGELFESFTGMNVDVQVPDNAAERRYYYTLVMAHEARHCDQDKDMRASALNEIDADVIADRLTSRGNLAAGLSADDRANMRSYWAALRLVNAVVGQDVGHYSTPGLLRGGITPMQAIDDSSTVRRLVQVLADGERKNKAVLPDSMEGIERRYHLAKALLADRSAGDAELRAKAALFVRAVDYLDGMLSINVIATPHARIASRIDMTWLTRDYTPVAPRPAATATPAAVMPARRAS